MIEFPSFEFVIVDKNTKGKGETRRSQRHIWKPFCSSVEREDENPTKVRNPASRKVGLTLSVEAGRCLGAAAELQWED